MPEIIEKMVEKYEAGKTLKNMKQVYTALNMSEQTFYSWQKKNPEAFQALIDGYLFQSIKEEIEDIVSTLKYQKVIKKY